MNTDILSQVAEWLEAGAPEVPTMHLAGFDMDRGIEFTNYDSPECGYECCIAGAICQFSGEGRDLTKGYTEYANWSDVFITARAQANLTRTQARDLFRPYDSINPTDTEQAARTIRHLIATGEVDWSI